MKLKKSFNPKIFALLLSLKCSLTIASVLRHVHNHNFIAHIKSVASQPVVLQSFNIVLGKKSMLLWKQMNELEDQEEKCCPVCRWTPCNWIQCSNTMEEHIENAESTRDEEAPNCNKRKSLHQLLTCSKHSHLGCS